MAATMGVTTGGLAAPMATTSTAVPRQGTLAVRVLMLDDTVATLYVSYKAIGEELYDEVIRHLQLIESDYFDLEFTDGQGCQCWLNREKLILRQVTSASQLFFKFSVKFYTPDPTLLEDEYTRYLYALQIKRDLATGQLPCNANTAALLSSYIAQAEMGDWQEEFGDQHLYLSAYRFVVQQTDDFLRKVAQYHRTHVGMPPREADFHLLDTARKVEMYGVRLHSARDHEDVPLSLSVVHLGINVYQHQTKINTFSWAKIRKLSFKRKKFLIKLHPDGCGYYKDAVEFYFETRNQCKNFWKKCVEHHAFFRCDAVAPTSRPRPRLISRGSSYRYSGRTQRQLQEYIRQNYIRRPNFERLTIVGNKPIPTLITAGGTAAPVVSSSTTCSSSKPPPVPPKRNTAEPPPPPPPLPPPPLPMSQNDDRQLQQQSSSELQEAVPSSSLLTAVTTTLTVATENSSTSAVASSPSPSLSLSPQPQDGEGNVVVQEEEEDLQAASSPQIATTARTNGLATTMDQRSFEQQESEQQQQAMSQQQDYTRSLPSRSRFSGTSQLPKETATMPTKTALKNGAGRQHSADAALRISVHGEEEDDGDEADEEESHDISPPQPPPIVRQTSQPQPQQVHSYDEDEDQQEDDEEDEEPEEIIPPAPAVLLPATPQQREGTRVVVSTQQPYKLRIVAETTSTPSPTSSTSSSSAARKKAKTQPPMTLSAPYCQGIKTTTNGASISSPTSDVMASLSSAASFDNDTMEDSLDRQPLPPRVRPVPPQQIAVRGVLKKAPQQPPRQMVDIADFWFPPCTANRNGRDLSPIVTASSLALSGSSEESASGSESDGTATPPLLCQLPKVDPGVVMYGAAMVELANSLNAEIQQKIKQPPRPLPPFPPPTYQKSVQPPAIPPKPPQLARPASSTGQPINGERPASVMSSDDRLSATGPGVLLLPAYRSASEAQLYASLPASVAASVNTLCGGVSATESSTGDKSAPSPLPNLATQAAAMGFHKSHQVQGQDDEDSSVSDLVPAQNGSGELNEKPPNGLDLMSPGAEMVTYILHRRQTPEKSTSPTPQEIPVVTTTKSATPAAQVQQQIPVQVLAKAPLQRQNGPATATSHHRQLGFSSADDTLEWSFEAEVLEQIRAAKLASNTGDQMAAPDSAALRILRLEPVWEIEEDISSRHTSLAQSPCAMPKPPSTQTLTQMPVPPPPQFDDTQSRVDGWLQTCDRSERHKNSDEVIASRYVSALVQLAAARLASTCGINEAGCSANGMQPPLARIESSRSSIESSSNPPTSSSTAPNGETSPTSTNGHAVPATPGYLHLGGVSFSPFLPGAPAASVATGGAETPTTLTTDAEACCFAEQEVLTFAQPDSSNNTANLGQCCYAAEDDDDSDTSSECADVGESDTEGSFALSGGHLGTLAEVSDFAEETGAPIAPIAAADSEDEDTKKPADECLVLTFDNPYASPL